MIKGFVFDLLQMVLEPMELGSLAFFFFNP